MKPGRELDCLIHRAIFGQQWARFEPAVNIINVPPYSSDIRAAWEVFERLTSLKHQEGCEVTWQPGLGYRCDVRIDGLLSKSGWVDSAPHAICLAALEAGGGQR